MSETECHGAKAETGDQLPLTNEEVVEQFAQVTPAKEAIVRETVELLVRKTGNNAALITEIVEFVSTRIFVDCINQGVGLTPLHYMRFISNNANNKIQYAVDAILNEVDSQDSVDSQGEEE